MSKAVIDKIELLECEEHEGHIRRLVRGYLVKRLTYTNYEALIEALDDANVPKYEDRLDNGPVGYPLIVTNRSVKMVDEDNRVAMITVTYESAWRPDRVMDNFDEPHLGNVVGEVRCSIQQKSSNLDGGGNQIVLSHTYDANDPNFPGETRFQGGELQYYEAQRSFSVQGIKFTRTPWVIANRIVGRVNKDSFSGEPARHWLCVACNWNPQGTQRSGTQGYYMRFEFQFDPDSWDPGVVYTDEVTGKPPINLVPGVGYKTIQKLPETDFEAVIGTSLQGA